MELVKPGELVTAFDLEIAAMLAEEGARRYPSARWDVGLLSISATDSAALDGPGADVGARFQAGDVVVHSVIGRLARLVVKNEWTLFVGGPQDERRRRAFEAATAAREAAAVQMVAVVPVANADVTAQKVIAAAGFGECI